MSGNKIGGKKAAQTNKEIYGEDFYRNIGSLGGIESAKSGHLARVGFGADRERAREAGRKGGLKSRRGPVDKQLH